MYCRQCGYHLAGLSENRCPECGRTFDQGNPRTFAGRPYGWLLWRWLRRALFASLSLLVVIAVAAGWLYWDWRTEQPAIGALRAAVDSARGKPQVIVAAVALPWMNRWVFALAQNRPFLAKWTGALWAWQRLAATGLLDRAVKVQLPISDEPLIVEYGPSKHAPNPAMEACIPLLKQLPYLQSLTLCGDWVTDAQLQEISHLRPLRRLYLWHPSISNGGLAHLRALDRLVTFGCEGLQITGEGIEHLSALPGLEEIWCVGTPRDARLEAPHDFGVYPSRTGRVRMSLAVAISELALTSEPQQDPPGLQRIRLMRMPLSDEDLSHLGPLPYLEVLDLRHTWITDAGIVHLRGIINLRTLTLHDTGVSREGVKTLKQDLPEVNIDWP